MKRATLVNAPIRGHTESTRPVVVDDVRPAPARPLPGRRLLVVEDDRIIRSALRSGLELHGYEVAAVGNGLEALEAVTRSAPDLVVLDLAMPGLSGQGFVEALTLRGLRPGLHIVVLSVNPDVEERARQMGADAGLRKPLHLAALVREIERVLGN